MVQIVKHVDEEDIELDKNYSPIDNLFLAVVGNPPAREYDSFDVSGWLGVLRNLPGRQYVTMSFYYGIGCTNKTIQQIADFFQIKPRDVEKDIRQSLDLLRSDSYCDDIKVSFGGTKHLLVV